jgi:hypothetical protein
MSGSFRRSSRGRRAGRFTPGLALAGLLWGAACTGDAASIREPGDEPRGAAGDNGGGGSPVPGAGGAGQPGVTPPGPGGGGSGPGPGTIGGPTAATPGGACNTAVSRRVTRLRDRHIANAIRDLLALEKTPEVSTGAAGTEEFLPNKAAVMTGAVAVKLGDVVGAAAAEATATGKPAVRCTGAEADCARTFIDRFASRAFRRPVAAEEREKLLGVYRTGTSAYGGHAGGLRLVIEAVLQSPSFLYQTELGGAASGGRVRLTPFEVANKLSFFLRDSIPDDELWKAAEEGKLATAEGIGAEVDRMLKLPQVKANVSKMLSRLFQLDRMENVNKAPSIREFTPALAQAMLGETERFIDDVMWKGKPTLGELLSSRKSFIDRTLAPIYGVKAPTTSGFVETMLPATERAGILTQASLLTIEATPDDSSVVHRGVFLVREMLCFHPPPPSADDIAQGEALAKVEPTERGRAEKRMSIPRCQGCHAFFDPLGVAFENYDTLGRWRTRIKTPTGDVPVDASWTFDLEDIKGRVANGLELSKKLAESATVRSCMVRQFASYALGQRLGDEEMCTVQKALSAFESSGGDLLQLIKAVAAWDGLRERKEGDPQ